MKRTTPQDPLLDDARKHYARAAKCAPIVRKDVDRQLVYGVVYAPGEIDAHGEMMLAHDIETMAHLFLQKMVETGNAVIDVEHDNQAIGAYPVESYIETRDDQDWPAGSWVLGVKIADPVIWAKVKSGELNGYSFEAMVNKMPMVVSVEVAPDMIGKTAENEGHDHVFFLEFDKEGRVSGGSTSMDAGHRHQILAGTATETAGTAGVKPHAHRLPVI